MNTRVFVFIDNSNIFKRLEQLNKIDKKWIKAYDPSYLAQKISGNRELAGTQFYCSPPPTHLLSEKPETYWKQISYYEAVKKLPNVEVKYGELKGVKGNINEKNLDTQMTADIIAMGFENKYDVAVVISNDGDFQSAVETVKRIGKGVEVVYFKNSVSMSLKQYADVMRKIRQKYIKRLPFEVKNGE